MKRSLVICVVLTIALLSGCQSNVSEEVSPANPSASDTTFEQQPFEVILTAENTTDNGKPVFKITTNLPDNTELLLTLKNTSGYTAQDKVTIKNGQGKSSSFSDQGNSLSGTYTLKVSMGMPSLQDQSVQNVIGSRGEYMSGSIVQESSMGSNTYNVIEAEFVFDIGGNATASNSSTNNPSSNKTPTTGENNALISAKQYLNTMAFSYSGLIEQLEYEGYTNSEAIYAVNNCGADWYEQAELSAKEYLDVMPFSRQGLIEQLEYEGFTHSQAVYGVEQNGY